MVDMMDMVNTCMTVFPSQCSLKVVYGVSRCNSHTLYTPLNTGTLDMYTLYNIYKTKNQNMCIYYRGCMCLM